jgi:hypothetical protein
MMIRIVTAFIGLAVGVALPAFAQQKDAIDMARVQRRNLLSDAEELDQFIETLAQAGRGI